ncbi:putative ribosomal protein S6 kinase alpha-1 [Xenia sp. Carnegie-2017]|uniref:putative ribosomal protein S6 kinase alpha-1 n=1 Tax=Xenia sp. Carnegie-2017 TaxID=2897299 RepID=UPI001F04098A|nr:putative ribosomal protein S6 kinase alpha-1 [Xenia sp. Carnegie-2017]
MLKLQPEKRPSANEALKHPFFMSDDETFEFLCKVGKLQSTKTNDPQSSIVQHLNIESSNWRSQIDNDVYNYLVNGREYKSSWTECLRLIRNTGMHWNDRPRPLPQPEAFYKIGDYRAYFLKTFPSLPVRVHAAVRSNEEWKDNPELKDDLRIANYDIPSIGQDDLDLMPLHTLDRNSPPFRKSKSSVSELQLQDGKFIGESTKHRKMLLKLCEYRASAFRKVNYVGDVCVIFSDEFCIGRGNDGTPVYLGLRNDGYGKAVKRIRRDNFIDLTRREKEILNELNAEGSKYVVNYSYLMEDNDTEYGYLILDLCEESLESFVKSSTLSDLEKALPEILRPILQGLAYLHSGQHPILHRNLKPSNVLRDSQGKFLIADFGIKTMANVGTEFWIAPESYCKEEDSFDKARYITKSDVMNAGMVAYYVATKGKHPFGTKPHRLINMLNGKPVGMDEIKDETLKDLLSRMLKLQPEERPSANEALKHPFLMSDGETFEFLCKVGNLQSTKTNDPQSSIVQHLNAAVRSNDELKNNPELKEPQLQEWKYLGHSIQHRSLLSELCYPGADIKHVGNVRVIFSEKFCLGKGSNETRVYLGLTKDGYGKAVKRMLKDNYLKPAKHEKKILNEFNSKNSKYVVNYYFLEEDTATEYVYLMLDLCEESLEKFVKSSSLSDLQKALPDILRQILNGLADLHNGPDPILHRHLKPSNVLRDVDGRFLIADFGISQILKNGSKTHKSNFNRGTLYWIAPESFREEDLNEAPNEVLNEAPNEDLNEAPNEDSNKARNEDLNKARNEDSKKGRYKKESDVYNAGMVAYYVATKGKHPFGIESHRLNNMLNGNPVGLDEIKDETLKDLLSWMLKLQPEKRPSANEAMKHPFLMSDDETFEFLCKVGNLQSIKTNDSQSSIVQHLNSESSDWKSQMENDIYDYLVIGRKYGPSWTECLRLIRNIGEHWYDRPRTRPQPEPFYKIGDHKTFFLKTFPNLPVRVHAAVRSNEKLKNNLELKDKDDDDQENINTYGNEASAYSVEETSVIDNSHIVEDMDEAGQDDLRIANYDIPSIGHEDLRSMPFDTTSINEDVLATREICQLSYHIASFWDELASMMNMESYEIDNVRSNTSYENEQIKAQKILSILSNKWKTEFRSKLVETLDSMNKFDLADSIFNYE